MISRFHRAVAALALALAAGTPQVGAGTGWTSESPLVFARGLHTATTLDDGSVLVVGGRGCPGTVGSTSFPSERYDSDSATWSFAPAPLVTRDRHAAIRLLDGRVLVAGGQSTQGACPARLHTQIGFAEIFDPESNGWAFGGLMKANHVNLTLSLLPNGEVLALNERGAEIFDPTTTAWRWTAQPSFERSSHTSTTLGDGRVLVTGGSPVSGAIAAVESFSVAGEEWSSLTPMNVPRQGHQATPLLDGRVLVAGGVGSEGIIDSAEIYDPASDTWTSVAPMNEIRAFFTLTTLTDGRVLAAGGSSAFGGPGLSSAETFDPSTGRWTPTAAMPSWHTSHVAASLADGGALVISGGYELYGFTNAVDRFRP